MIRLLVRTPTNTINEIFARPTSVFLTTRGQVEAQHLNDQDSHAGPDSVQYLTHCPRGTWFRVVQKETV
jgi:hypothetical protein